MNTEWQEFLLSQNATIHNNCVSSFGATIDEEQSAYSKLVLADLSHYALIEASGDDVVEFLQGQLTNDTKLINDKLSQLSAYCNPKGRILANFRIFKRNEHYLLSLPADTSEATLKRLRMFVMRSKVELIDSSDTLIHVGIAGMNAPAKLNELFKTLPQLTDEACYENDITLIKLAGELPRYEAYGSLQSIKQLWEQLQNEAQLIGENSWNLLTVRAAIPEIVAATVEEFVPQMVNLQAINSLSFTKGCYPGQEVVARMHYLGKLKRRLFHGYLDSDTLPQAGQAIYAAAENKEKAGQIVSASWSKDHKIELLAVLKIDKAEGGPLYLDSENQTAIEFLPLPYSLEIK